MSDADSTHNKLGGTVHGDSVQMRDVHGNLVFGPTSTPPPKPRQLPAACARFVGREAQVAALTSLAGTGRLVVLANSTPGIGKTALALHWAHSAAQRFPDGQLFVDLRGSSPHGLARRPVDVVHDILVAFGVAAPPSGPDAQIALYRSLLADKRVLFVLDDARDADQVIPLLPPSGDSLVVVTSRRPLADLVAAGAAWLPLDGLDHRDSADLLCAHGAETDPAIVGALVELCAGLPAALNAVVGTAGGGPLDAVASQLSAIPDIGRNPDPAMRAQRIVAWAQHRDRGTSTPWAKPFAEAAWLRDHRLLIGAAVALGALVTAVSTQFLEASGLLGALYFLLRFAALGAGLSLMRRSGPRGALGAGLAAGTSAYLLTDALVSINASGRVLVWLELLTSLLFAALLWLRIQPVRNRPRRLGVVLPARRPVAFGALVGVALWFVLLFTAIDLDEYTSITLIQAGGALGALLPVIVIGGICAIVALTEITGEIHRLFIAATVTAYLLPELFMLVGSLALGDRMAYFGGGVFASGVSSSTHSVIQTVIFTLLLVATLLLLRGPRPTARRGSGH